MVSSGGCNIPGSWRLCCHRVVRRRGRGVVRCRPSVRSSWSCVSRGWSICAAARAVGVSRSSGNNWASDYKTYRKGQLVGFVPALDRFTMRQISAWFLSQAERIEIADLRAPGQSVRQITAKLQRAPSTISRELRRNTAAGRDYRPMEPAADQPTLATSVPRRSGHAVMRLCGYATRASIRRAMSPDQRSCGHPGWQPHRHSPLRTGREHRRAQQNGARRPPRFQQPMLTIHQLPSIRRTVPKQGIGNLLNAVA